MGGSRIKQLGAKVQQILTALPEMRSAFAESVAQGSVHRLRPKLMTVAAVLASLIPILSESGVGSDVMKPIAAPLPVPIPIRASRRLRIRLVQKFRNFPLATSRLLQTRCYSRTKARRPMPRSSLPPFRPGPKIKENLSSPNTKTPLMRRMPGSPKSLTRNPESEIKNFDAASHTPCSTPPPCTSAATRVPLANVARASNLVNSMWLYGDGIAIRSIR